MRFNFSSKTKGSIKTLTSQLKNINGQLPMSISKLAVIAFSYILIPSNIIVYIFCLYFLTFFLHFPVVQKTNIIKNTNYFYICKHKSIKKAHKVSPLYAHYFTFSLNFPIASQYHIRLPHIPSKESLLPKYFLVR